MTATRAKRRYIERGPTGFLKPAHSYTIEVLGELVFATTNTRDAEKRFALWQHIAPQHWNPTLKKNGIKQP